MKQLDGLHPNADGSTTYQYSIKGTKGGEMSELDKQIREIMSFVLMDGQNQIHDLKDGRATPEQITERMFTSLDYHTPKVLTIIAKEVRKGQKEAERPFRELMLNKGSHPSYHDQQVEHLKVHWPTLYSELARIAELAGGGNE